MQTDQNHMLTTGGLQVDWVRVLVGGCQVDLFLKEQIHLSLNWNGKTVCSFAKFDELRMHVSRTHTFTLTQE